VHPLFDLNLYGPAFKDVQLVKACGQCKKLTRVEARYLESRNLIRARCPCGSVFSLDQTLYASAFPEAATKRLRHRHNHNDKEFVPRDPPYLIFNRYGYRCIYHEGSEEAKRIRLQQVDAIASRMPSAQTTLDVDPRLREAIVGSAFDEELAKNLFGLVPDHLVPRSLTRRFEAEMTERQRELCKREWIVAACTHCNEERSDKIESADALLFLYSRYLMPHRGRTAPERLLDASEFVKVLDILARGIVVRRQP
jgi:hypothetical protein